MAHFAVLTIFVGRAELAVRLYGVPVDLCPLFGVQITGSLKGNRTPISSVRGMCPNR